METYIIKMRSWWKGDWDMYSDDRLVGSLVLKKRFSWALAEVTAGGNKWMVGYQGMNTSRLFVHDTSNNEMGALTVRDWWGSTADVTLGNSKYEVRTNAWGTSHTAHDANGVEVLRIKANWRGGAAVTVSGSATPGKILLTFLLFYRMKLAETTGAAAGAGATVVVTAGS